MAPWWQLVLPYAARPWNQPEKYSPPSLDENGLLDFKPGDDENPQNWSSSRRWWITVCSTFVVLNGTMASSAPSGCLQSLTEHFNVSETAANLSITLYLLGYCAGPFFFSPLSEFYGRRWVMWFTFLAYVAFTFLTAFPPNFGGFLVGRLLAGIFVAGPIANAPAVYADIWEPVRRDDAMVLYATIVWSGPNLGLVAAAFLDEALNWRWSFHFILMLCAFNILLMMTIPETNSAIILKQKAMRIRNAKIPGYSNVKAPSEADEESIIHKVKVLLAWPWFIAVDKIALLCNVYLAVVFTLQFMLYSVYPMAFTDIRGIRPSIAQLPLIGAVVGALIAACILLYDTRWRAKMALTTKVNNPERRLYMAMIGGITFPIAMFWFAWTAHFE
jgi:MFS family permease